MIYLGTSPVGVTIHGTPIEEKGSFTLDSKKNAVDIIIPHHLGVVPQAILIWAPDYLTEVETRGLDTVGGNYYNIYAPWVRMDAWYYTSTSAETPTNGNMASTNTYRQSFEAALSSTQFMAIGYNQNYKYAAGVTYNWIALANIDTTFS